MNHKQTLANLYLDWLNNYLTVEKFAEDNNFTIEQASQLIDIGRDCHNDIVNKRLRG